MENIIRNYRTDDKKNFTHTYFGQKYILKLNIPNDSLKDFYDAYFANYKSFTGCITEKSQKLLVFFVDLDVPFEAFTNGLVELDDMEEFITTAIAVVSRNLQLFQYEEEKTTSVVTAFRLPYKCHLHFPEIIIKGSMAKLLVKKVESEMIAEFPWIATLKKDYKKDVFDNSVYTSGLRILGCSKDTMKRNSSTKNPDLKSEKELHEEFFECDYQHRYSLAEFVDGTLTYKPLEREHLDLITIITSETSEDDDEKEKQLKRVRDRSSSPTLVPKKSKTVWIEDDLVIDYVKTQMKKINFEFEEAWEPKIVTLKSAISIELPVGNICPFAGREHRRSIERNVPANYVLITSFDSTLRCWKCPEKKSLDAPASEIQEELENNCPDLILKRSLYNPTHENVSEFIFSQVFGTFASSRNETTNSYTFYYFESKLHRWIKGERLFLLIMRANGLIQKLYRAYISTVISNEESDEDTKVAVKEAWKKLETSLQTFSFVSSGLMPMLGRKLEDYWFSKEQGSTYEKTSFQSKLDSDPLLLGFQNGVYDFGLNVFRAGIPEDFISMSTKLPYKEYSLFPENLRNDMGNALKKIFVKKNHLYFFLEKLAQSLNGVNKEQKFYILTGAGANGKSIIVKLINYALGNYAGEVNVTLFTKPRPAANVPMPELIAIKGVRVMTTSEPNEKDSLNMGTIKWVSGGDRVTAAAKYEANQSFYPQCGWFMLTNDIPDIPAAGGQNDWGTWRRVFPISFKSQFVEKLSEPPKPNEFLADPEIESKLESWGPVFVSLLIKMSKDLTKRLPTPIPNEFIILWKQLQNKNDIYTRFVEELLDLDENAFTSKNDIWQSFHKWVVRYKLGSKKSIDIDKFEQNMLNILGNYVEDAEGEKGWKANVRYVRETL